MMTRRVGIVGVLLVALIWIPALSTSGSGIAAASPTDTSCQSPGIRIPVIFVHGLGGSPADFTSHANGAEDLIQRIGAIPGTYTDLFSYAPENLDWVTNPGIGQALANEITCEAAKSKQAGGSGKVIVIAHSMGGLAVREAASLTGAGTGQPASASIGLIITIATPNTGSWDDGLFHNVRAGVGGTVPELLAWVVQGVCGGVGFVAGSDQPGEQRPGLCAEVQGSTAQAGSAMVPGSSQLSALPSPPSAVPLDAVAGDLTVTAKLFLIHTTYTLVPQGELGDLLVKPDSALAYGADSGNQEYTDACSMPVSELFGNLGWNGCTHGGLLYDSGVGSQVASWVSQWIHPNIKNVTTSLAGLTPGQANSVVPIPDGYEAATWDDQSHIMFWKFIGSGPWLQVGHSTYPIVGNEPTTSTITGALLSGMTDATFIAQGFYSGDGTGNDIAFGNGPNGWGTLVPGPNESLVPSGHGSTDESTPGISYFERFYDGGIQESEPGTLPFGPNGEEWQVIREYHWNGNVLAQTSSNVFTASTATAPPQSPPSVTSCPTAPPDGTYTDFAAGVSASLNQTQQFLEPSSVTITIQGDGPSPACTFTVAPNFPVAIGVTTNAGSSWITAPAWALTQTTANGNDVGELLSGLQLPGSDNLGSLEFQDAQNSPYYIPTSLGVTQVEVIGPPEFTVKGGQLTSLAMLPPPAP
jgi:hypothetical protein